MTAEYLRALVQRDLLGRAWASSRPLTFVGAAMLVVLGAALDGLGRSLRPAQPRALRGETRLPPHAHRPLCFAAMLASTRPGNVPINNRTLEIDPEAGIEEVKLLRERGDRLHTRRVTLTTAGLAFLVVGALAKEDK